MFEIDKNDGIHTIRMAHAKANAMDLEFLRGLRDTLKQSADARAVIITARDSIFCAGVDLVRLTNEGAQYALDFYPELVLFLRDLFEFERPVVAAVNGHAIAGGALIAFASDYKIMARGNGRFGIPELLVGVPFPPAALEIARFAISPGLLQSLVYTGATHKSDEAYRLGLVDELAEPEQLEDRALAVARQLGQIPTDLFTVTKRALRAPTIARYEEAARTDAERLRIWSAPETRERVRTYVQNVVKR